MDADKDGVIDAAWFLVARVLPVVLLGGSFGYARLTDRGEGPIDAIRSLDSPVVVAPEGAHGRRGRWLVNGSSRGIVQILLDSTQPGSMAGLPVKVTELLVSAEDPDRLVAALGPPL